MRSVRTKMATVALALCVAAAAAWLSDPVAVIVQFEGDVQVQRAGEPAAVEGAVGMQLAAGDRVIVGEGARAILLHRTGRMERASESVTLAEPEDQEPNSLFTQTLRTLGQVATTDARSQPNRQGMIRPITGAPVPIAPRNDIAVLDVRPTFTWFSVPEAERYMVQIRRVAPTETDPVRYEADADTTWTYPSTATPLVPGATYAWTVGPIGAGRPASEQRFKVVTAETLAAVQDALESLMESGMDPGGEGLFLAALTYRDAGLFYEAERALEHLEARGDAAGFSYYMLRGEVADAVGDRATAEQAFELADGSRR